MRIGVITNPSPRGNAVSLSIPAGKGREIDVFGVYPSSNCGGGGSSDGSGGGGGGHMGGFGGGHMSGFRR